MKLRYLVSLAILASVVGCSNTAPSIQTGDDAEVTYDGLVRVDNTIMDSVWARPDIALTGYNQVMFVPVGISYRDVEPSDTSGALRRSTRSRHTELQEFQLDEETKARFEAEISAAFDEEVSASEVFTIVEEPGPEVLKIGVALLDVVPPSSSLK